jgi:putative addiction module component (TIGR02574 family)
MQDEAKKLLDAALRLPLEARAALAGSLLESLEEDGDEGVEAAWADELGRRIRELNEGQATCAPWAVARRRILGDA